MGTPIAALDRPSLERRYRRSTTLNLVLGLLSAVLLGVLAIDAFAAPPEPATSSAADERSQGGAADGAAAADGADGADGAAQPEGGALGLERRIDGDPMAIGDVDAPVVLIEWVDFRCPFCAVYARDTYPTLIEEHVETGEVRIEMRDVAFFGEESARAAAAARAAGEQGRYFEFVEAVYAAAPESGHPELPLEELVELAEVAGVSDIERFKTDMTRDDLVAAVSASTDEAHRIGVTGVPFFVVGDQAFSGAQPIDSFRSVLDEAIASAG